LHPYAISAVQPVAPTCCCSLDPQQVFVYHASPRIVDRESYLFKRLVYEEVVAVFDLKIRAFGKFTVECQAHRLSHFEAAKAQELFCYLLLHRAAPHSRETLAGMLWGEMSTALSRKMLRQALWQLQSTLATLGLDPEQLLLVDAEWIQFNPRAALWLDVAIFEQACALVQDLPGEQIDRACLTPLQQALELYQGELLEGWYQEWCLYERERLLNLYLTLLDKLMRYCEAHAAYETGLQYGARILRYDVARERTHRQMMRLHYLAGDRTAALRQYERCRATLHDELGVQPARQTEALYKQLCADRLLEPPLIHSASVAVTPLPELIERLEQIQAALIETRAQVQHGLQAIELALHHHNRSDVP
jgi:DNA-binding SARP family transcriptional activator